MSVYMDHNATTPMDPAVIQSVCESLNSDWANPSSSYTEGKAARSSIEKARANVGKMINSKPEKIIFTSGGTEANNAVIFGAADQLNEGIKNSRLPPPAIKHVITTDIEHDSVKKPLEYLKRAGLIELTFLSASQNGTINCEDVFMAIKSNTNFITIMLANNETGVILPVAEVGRRLELLNKCRIELQLPKILLHTDAAQAIGKIAVDVEDLKVDYLTIVGHKFYGPRIGALYVRDLQKIPEKFPGSSAKFPSAKFLDSSALHPFMYGGPQESGFRPGTENTPMIVGLGKAAALVSDNLERDYTHMEAMRDYLEKSLEEEFGRRLIVFNCNRDAVRRLPNTTNVSFTKEGFCGWFVLQYCEKLVASVGAACHSSLTPSEILLASGVPRDEARNAIRLSVGRFTTTMDVDAAVQDLACAIMKLDDSFSSPLPY